MGQKLLSYLFYGFLVLMVIAALFLLKHQLDQKDVKQQQIDSRANVVSRVDKEHIKKETKQNAAKNVEAASTIVELTETNSDSPLADQDLSYLDVYRRFQDSIACEPIFSVWLSNGINADLAQNIMVNPPNIFYGDSIPNPVNKYQISQSQLRQLTIWQKTCKNLWESYPISDKDLGSHPMVITNKVKQHLSNITPKTAKEIRLNKVLKTVTQWQKNFHNLKVALKGQDSLDGSKLSVLLEDINRLKQQNWDLAREIQSLENPTEQELEYIVGQQMDISKQIQNLEKQLENQKVVDDDKFSQALSKFRRTDQSLQKFLFGSDGDVFFEVLKTIEDQPRSAQQFIQIGYNNRITKKPGDGYRITPGQMVLSHSQWLNHEIQQDAIRFAAHLYLCDLGWRCGPDSPIMLQYCLFGSSSFPDACGLDLATFYQEHLMSANRWSDVMRFKAIFRELFHE